MSIKSPIQVTLEQKRKILAMASLIDGGDMAVLKKLVEFQEEMELFSTQYEKAKKELKEALDSYREDAYGYTSGEFKTIYNRLRDTEESLKNSIKDQKTLLSKEAKGLYLKLETALSEYKKANTEEIQKSLNELRALFGYLEDTVASIKEYEDSDIRSQIEALRKQIPEQVDVEDLENRIQELEERIKTMAGSVTKLQGASQTPSPMHWSRHQSFTMNGVATTVTLDHGVGAAGTAIILRYEGQTLDLGTHYTVSGNKVTLTFTPNNGATISVTYWP